MSLFLSRMLYFSRINQKNVLQKKITDLTFEVRNLVLDLIPVDWIIENDSRQILCLVLEFFVKQRRIGLLFAACLAQTQ